MISPFLTTDDTIIGRTVTDRWNEEQVWTFFMVLKLDQYEKKRHLDSDGTRVCTMSRQRNLIMDSIRGRGIHLCSEEIPSIRQGEVATVEVVFFAATEPFARRRRCRSHRGGLLLKLWKLHERDSRSHHWRRGSTRARVSPREVASEQVVCGKLQRANAVWRSWKHKSMLKSMPRWASCRRKRMFCRLQLPQFCRVQSQCGWKTVHFRWTMFLLCQR